MTVKETLERIASTMTETPSKNVKCLEEGACGVQPRLKLSESQQAGLPTPSQNIPADVSEQHLKSCLETRQVRDGEHSESGDDSSTDHEDEYSNDSFTESWGKSLDGLSAFVTEREREAQSAAELASQLAAALDLEDPTNRPSNQTQTASEMGLDLDSPFNRASEWSQQSGRGFARESSLTESFMQFYCSNFGSDQHQHAVDVLPFIEDSANTIAGSPPPHSPMGDSHQPASP
jgi:hypothetical protein